MSLITLTTGAATSLFAIPITIKNASDDQLQDFANTTAITDFTVVGTDSQASSVQVSEVSTTGTGARTLTVHPELSAAFSYTVTVVNHTGDNSASVTPATSLITSDHPNFPTPPLETLTHAFGEAFQKLIGVPETFVIKDFDSATSTVIFCETSLGFPTKGSLWINQQKFNYTGRYSGGFTGVTRDVSIGVPSEKKGVFSHLIIGAGALLRFDIFSHDAEDSIA